ncbi:helix-turn-helix transcriptional regulator [Paenibacillus sp. CAU 1782]
MDLSAVRSYMERHYDQPITVGQLAKIAGLSRNYFVDLFSKTYGQGAIGYLNSAASGRMHPIPSDPWCQYSASSIDRMLDELQLLLTGFCPNERMDLCHGEA